MSNPDSPKQGLQKRKTITQEKKIAEDEFMAAAIGDVEWLRQSLRGQKGVINFDRNGLAPIHLAAIHGRVECLKLLVEKFKVDVNTASATGWRPAHLCISNQTGKRAYQSLRYLLDKHADPSVANDDGITPMHQAASEGHVQCLKALIEAGGKVMEQDDRGHTPIDLAKLWGHRKCARILATENWHQSKHFLSKEMNQLQKIKMQQVLEEMEKDEAQKSDQAFYGDQAFNEWLTSRNLSMPEPPPSKVKPPPQPKPQKKKDSEPKESLQKANSQRRPGAGGKAPSPIKEEPTTPTMTARRNTFISPANDGYSSARSGRGEDAEKAKTASEAATVQPTVATEDSNPLWYNPNHWNKSTKVPGKPYEPILPDHYPHDEYTMKPYNAPRRKDFKKHPPYAQRGGKDSNKPSADGKLRMPALPPDVIKKTLNPEAYERPVVYKCKHIDDVHKKERYPVEVLPRQEVGIHLMDDMDSFAWKRALQPEKRTNQLALSPPVPSSAATFASILEKARLSSHASRESEKLAQYMGRMSIPSHYPRISGQEYTLGTSVM